MSYNSANMCCEKCVEEDEYPVIEASDVIKSSCDDDDLFKSCQFCRHEGERKFSWKVYPRESPEPPSPSSIHERPSQPSPVVFRRSSSRSDEEDTEDSGGNFFSPLSDYCEDDVSDNDTTSSIISARHNFFNCKSVGSSPSHSPVSTNKLTPNNLPPDPVSTVILKKAEIQISNSQKKHNITISPEKEKPLDFEKNGPIWFPPPAENESDETEVNFFEYDDEEDDTFSSSSMFPSKEKHEGNKEPLRAVVQAHFRALVSQLLQGEGIDKLSKDKNIEEWLDIVTSLAWQAANFVKPDTSKGGSMDPSDYVKVKCIATGNPIESTFIKGVVCTKNIKHKRMTSQYKNSKLLLLGGALEYQRVPNQLSSFNTLLQQEIDYLKIIISKIEAHRPNVLLVEKSVSSYAQEYLLAKEISLVLNVKRPLLERIARCTGALITPSVDSISTARLGHCDLFRLEKVCEDLEISNQLNKKSSKTLMFFEGCPRRLGCTVLLKGSRREELKKLKDVVQYAVFAAYHLSLETSFLADEGASLPKVISNPSITLTERETVNNSVTDVIISDASTLSNTLNVFPDKNEDFAGLNGEIGECEVSYENPKSSSVSPMSLYLVDCGCDADLALNLDMEVDSSKQNIDLNESNNNNALIEKIDENESSSEYFSTTDSHQSLLVSFSSRCVLKGTLCERSRLLRIKFYGCFDKPLGRYLQDDLFDQKNHCQSCNEAAEAHLQCFTHQQGSLTISVKHLPNVKLPGEHDGKIWMWHRCLRCTYVDGIPSATPRVVMSDAAWGLSFGKFLELSFSNHATANRVATCGHSLQRDCLRYYGFGSMVAFFRYTPIDILSVHLPPSMIDFNIQVQQDWIKKETAEIFNKMEILYEEIYNVLHSIEQRSTYFGQKLSETTDLHNYIMELEDLVEKEINEYNELLQPASMDPSLTGPLVVDIFHLNCMRRSLIIGSQIWDRRLSSLHSLLKIKSSNLKETQGIACKFDLKDFSVIDGQLESDHEDVSESSSNFFGNDVQLENFLVKINDGKTYNELSDKIDFAWTGTDQVDGSTVKMVRQISRIKKSPMRVYSFDSGIRAQDKIRKVNTVRSFHASGEYRNMIKYPVSNVLGIYSHLSLQESHTSKPLLISSTSQIADGARLFLPQTGKSNIIVAVYDDEPTSVISYALSSKEYENLIYDKPCENSSFPIWQSFASLDTEFTRYGSFGSEEASSSSSSSSISSLFRDTKKSPHLRIAFGDESLAGGGKVKFSVVCYFAKQFDMLRKKCCPSEVDFVRSLSRCKRWSAQGGKSNVYFAKSLDDRFIIKQVTKTELDSFEEFAPEYFKYLTDSLCSGSPTCLAKILGLYQVSVKHMKGGKETKMDLMVMENLFFKRNISRVYDLKGSTRSRYNPDTTGANAVLLDMNLLETLRTNPIFLSSKAKRSLERAVWNDTSFLASVDVMDYSLLVGVDEEKKELVLGIIDIMRQYTWDKHLETWVKASGILGGPKNASPTIISPKQYKRRFRKAMTTYFLTVPDQWSS